MQVNVNRERADAVFTCLLERYQKRQHPYNLPGVEKPNAIGNLPAGLRRNKYLLASFMFKLCYWMRGGNNSNTACQMLGRMYENSPSKIFDPWYAQSMLPAVVSTLMEANGLGSYAETNGVYWVENSRRLVQLYDGDVRNVLKGVSDYDRACERIIRGKNGTGFFGFQHKMTSMLIHFLADEGLIEPFLFPVPVDFHIMRIVVSTGVVSVDTIPKSGLYIEPVLREVRQVSMDYCASTGIDPVELGNALWLYSKHMCRYYPGNASSTGEYDARRTKITAHDVTWSDTQLRKYARSCGRCRIEKFCTLSVPNAPYQRQGVLAPRGPRLMPSQGRMFSFDPEYESLLDLQPRAVGRRRDDTPQTILQTSQRNLFTSEE